MFARIQSAGSLRLIFGCCCLLACLGGVYTGMPLYETTIDTQAPTEEAMADSLAAYSPAGVEPIAFETLSAEEQTVIKKTIQSPARVHTDRGWSAQSVQLTYRNDVAFIQFVQYEGAIDFIRGKRLRMEAHPVSVR